MNKAPAVAAFLGYLGTFVTGDPSLMAQKPNQPIRFGQKGELTYELAPQHYEGLDHRMTSDSRRGKNWGRMYLDHHGNFQLWGDLDEAHFLYESQGTLSIRRGNSTITLVDKPPIEEGRLRTELEKRDALKSNLPDTAKYLSDSLRALYNDTAYMGDLNVTGVSTEVEKLKKDSNSKKLEDTLNLFKR